MLNSGVTCLMRAVGWELCLATLVPWLYVIVGVQVVAGANFESK